MKAALLVLSLLGQPTIPISDRVPIFNVEALCRDVSADDKASGLTLAQDAGECVRDETIAQQQLSSTWLTVPGPARDSCEGEAAAGGIESYVDLLTCRRWQAGRIRLRRRSPRSGERARCGTPRMSCGTN
jgi:hypothetical protein